LQKNSTFVPVEEANPTYGSSSTLENNSKRYGHENLKADSPESWCEGNSGDGIEEYVSLVSEKPFFIKRFFIQNGYGLKNYYALNNRVKVLEIKGDTTSELVNLADKPEIQEINLNQEISGKEIRFIIKEIYKGSKFSDTCIHKLTFTNLSPTDQYEASKKKLSVLYKRHFYQNISIGCN
jgi:hypothetical protein